jgi:hypothetical protein
VLRLRLLAGSDASQLARSQEPIVFETRIVARRNN